MNVSRVTKCQGEKEITAVRHGEESVCAPEIKSQGKNILESWALCDVILSCVTTKSQNPGISISYR